MGPQFSAVRCGQMLASASTVPVLALSLLVVVVVLTAVLGVWGFLAVQKRVGCSSVAMIKLLLWIFVALCVWALAWLRGAFTHLDFTAEGGIAIPQHCCSVANPRLPFRTVYGCPLAAYLC